MEARGRGDPVERLVMRFGEDGVEPLLVEGEADRHDGSAAAQMPERAIVMPPAIAEPGTTRIKAEQRHDDASGSTVSCVAGTGMPYCPAVMGASGYHGRKPRRASSRM
jgi:hypothetical protein